MYSANLVEKTAKERRRQKDNWTAEDRKRRVTETSAVVAFVSLTMAELPITDYWTIDLLDANMQTSRRNHKN